MTKNIHINAIFSHIRAENRNQLLMIIAKKICSDLHYNWRNLAEQLIEEEEKTNSAIGEGIALVNLKLPDIPKRYNAVFTLDHPVDFNALDGVPIKTVGIVISPEKEGPIHLRTLSRMARALKNKLIQTHADIIKTAQEMNMLIENPNGWLLAA